MKKIKVKVRVKARAPVISQEVAVAHVKESGERGITGRELAKVLGLPDAMPALRALSRCDRALIRSEWTPCADAKTHYALQEARYWMRSKP